MKLLIINDHGIFGGGTETRIRIFVEQLLKDKAANEVHVLQRFSNPQKECDSFKDVTNVVFFHTLHANESAYTVACKIIRENKINMVQVHNLVSTEPYVIFAAKQAGIPVVWWVHDYWLLCGYRSFINPYKASQETLCRKADGQVCHRCMSLKTRIKHALWKRIMNMCDRAIAPSSILKEIHEQENVMRNKWNVVVPWIDPFFLRDGAKKEKDKEAGKISKENKKEIILLFVGSLIEFKGAWVAARSLKYIVKRYPQVKLVFVGGNQEKESKYRLNIEEIGEADNTQKHMLFVGKKEKEELIELYKKSDIYLCPTVCMESFGQTWAEAMVSGIPVIVSAIGSIPEYVQDKKTGLLFQAGDHEALAARVLELLDNPKVARQIAEEGMRYAQRQFTCQRAVAEISKVYAGLLEKKMK